MDLVVSTQPPESCPCDALAVGAFAGGAPLQGAAARVDQALGGLLSAVMAEERFDARPGRTLLVHTQARIPARRIIVTGLGDRGGATAETLRLAAAAAARRAVDGRAAHLALPAVSLEAHPADVSAQASVEGVILGAYRFARYKQEEQGRLERVELLAADAAEQRAVEEGLRRGRVMAEATVLARDLVNEPPNVLTPVRLAEVAAALARNAGLRCSVLDVEAMQALGMGAILAIGTGSENPPRLIVLEYRPPGARKGQKTVAIVGKGVTFDSGGLNLKREHLEWMKSDMAGGAAVLAVMSALPALRPRVRVLGVVPAVENLPSGRAVKPGDIVRAMNGKTIEITNTDAEGRVILADALAYAAQQQPDEIIDLATLTGSAMVALGYLAAALMSNDRALQDRLLAAAERAGERLWPLPLYEEYLDKMRSPVADLRNSGGRFGGAEKGAIFLREFVGGRPWAHLDIAPTAFLETDEGTGPYLPKGGTGYGVRTLLTYLTTEAKPATRAPAPRPPARRAGRPR